MKELSIEEKALAYDEAIKLARNFHEDENCYGYLKGVLEHIFCELKEPDDEEIRKTLLETFSNFNAAGTFWTDILRISKDKVLAWLEKQSEQKPIDRVEPKFHEGDWITNGNAINHISKIRDDGFYCFDYGPSSDMIQYIDNTYHLWTILDAENGDVLASKDGLNILIFRNLDTSTSFSSYYNIAGKGELGWSNERFIPATKEQRDHLFAKMREADYEWDDEKKELRKIKKQDESIKIKKGKNYLCTKTHKYAGVEWIEGVIYYSPEDYSLVNQGCTCYCFKYSKEEHNNFFKEVEYDGCLEKQREQPKWTEEDEKSWLGIIDEIEANKSNAPDYDIETYDRFLSWLKSLKQRIEEQQ